jgi:hypothetical protein
MGALIPLAISVAPEIAKWLFGSNAAAATNQVTQVVQAVTGTSDPAAVEATLLGKPELATQLRVQLAQVAVDLDKADRAADQAELQSRLADVANARSQTVLLSQAHSLAAWGAPAVSLVVLATFGVVMGLALTRAFPAGSETILNMLLGTLAAMATSVVSYWVGSSAGSARKDARLAQQQPATSRATAP